MRRPLVRALTRPLILAAAVAAIPLLSAAPAASDGVVGGFPVDVSQSPWTVALSSRDRFGGTRSGQFCGGVAVGSTLSSRRPTVWARTLWERRRSGYAI